MRPLSRRSIILGLAAPLARPSGLRAQGAVFDCDVAIVGAGAAGLSAARQLQKLGKAFVILEARARIGGRMFTDTRLGAPYDAGAVYIHWAERNPWRDIAAELGVTAVNNDALSTASEFFNDGRRAQRRGDRGNFQAIDNLFDPEKGEVPDISMAARVAALPVARAGGAEAIARMSLGDEPENISALDYARLWSGDDLLVPSGYGALAENYARGLDIHTATPVTAIDYSGAGVALETPAGRVTARAAIITVPVGVLQKGVIRFAPSLPGVTRDGLNGLGMGALTKIGLRFDGARFGLAPATDLWDRRGPRSSFDFECWTWDRDVIVAYLGGDHARSLVARGERAAIETALDELTDLIGPDVRKHFVHGVLNGWCADPWSLGCYSHALPGNAGARAKLAAPVADRLFFAGEATGGESFGGAMTAGGAWLAGQAAARAAAG